MRQAYDYWQDQPGNYFPAAEVEFTHRKHPLLTSHIEAGSFLGWAFVTRLEMPPHLKCSLVHRSCTQLSTVKCTGKIQPAMGTPYPQVSQVLGTDLPVQKTRITSFSEDYHRPAAPCKARRQSRWIPKWLFDNRFSTSAINPHPSALQTWVSESTDVRLYRWLQVHILTYPPGMPHPKSAHPDMQVHQ